MRCIDEQFQEHRIMNDCRSDPPGRKTGYGRQITRL